MYKLVALFVLAKESNSEAMKSCDILDEILPWFVIIVIIAALCNRLLSHFLISDVLCTYYLTYGRCKVVVPQVCGCNISILKIQDI